MLKIIDEVLNKIRRLLTGEPKVVRPIKVKNFKLSEVAAAIFPHSHPQQKVSMESTSLQVQAFTVSHVVPKIVGWFKEKRLQSDCSVLVFSQEKGVTAIKAFRESKVVNCENIGDNFRLFVCLDANLRLLRIGTLCASELGCDNDIDKHGIIRIFPDGTYTTSHEE